MAPAEDIRVLLDLHMLAGGQIVSGSDFVALETFMSWLPPIRLAQSKAPKNEPAPPKRPASFLAKHPWMTKFVEEEEAASSSTYVKGTSSKPSHAEEGEEGDPEALADGDIEAIFTALEERRAAWDLHAEGEHADFKVSLLGGAWTQAHKGQAYDAFRGVVREGSKAEQWCLQYHLQRSARFDTSTYGEAGACTMAHARCHRMHFLFLPV